MAETKIRDFLQEKIVRNPLFDNYIVTNKDLAFRRESKCKNT